ncbi:MAG TPA: SprT family protein [Tetragenococcus sp.]|nr:SprT family protein [Tetragenococcus sp.]
MTEEELQVLVERVSLKFFDRPFCHQAVFNRRLKTTGGRYHLYDHHLDFNPKMVACGRETLIGIIKHELCHYHLHLQHKGYQHKDRDFKQLLAQTGGLRYAPIITSSKKFHSYRCSGCGQVFYRQRKIDLKRYVCAKCGHPLTEYGDCIK